VLSFRYIKCDEIWAGLIEGWYEKTIREFWILSGERESYRRDWWEAWNGAGRSGIDVAPLKVPTIDKDPGEGERMDFILTVPNALPAVPHDGMKDGWTVCGYTFLFNLVRFILCIWEFILMAIFSSIIPLVFCP
jgi:hypothetical protein